MRALLGALLPAVMVLGAGTAASASEYGPAKRAPKATPRLVTALKRPVPTANLWVLTQRVKLHSTIPIPHVVNPRSPNYAVGRMDTFWVLQANSDRYARMRARIVCETPHLYLYVQRSIHPSLAKACRSALYFERHIYPTDRRTFGSEWRPGVDGDPHITLVFGHIAGLAGYFSGADEYPRVVNAYSNQREIMYVSADYSSLGQSDFADTAAHEFQHMIHWHLHRQDEAWDNEGASVLAQVINGYTSDGFDQSYASNPVQLDSWSDGFNDPNYGAGFLWMDYLYQRFGQGFIHSMLQDKRYSGLSLAAHVLHRRVHLSLRKVFGDWVVANFLNDPRQVPKYGYRNSSVHVAPDAQLTSVGGTYRHLIHPYQPRYLALKNLNHIHGIRFTGAPRIPLIDAGPGPFWWSNRCDYCDTTMTRAIDLRGSHNPVLRFSAWYQIEKGYDYAYVEVSKDGGQTWHALRLPVSSNQNPNGNNLGNGITGQSQTVSGNTAGWLNLHASLRRFKDRRILLRFEYVTDDEYNGQSLAIRAIRVDGVKMPVSIGDPDWKLNGFMPVKRNSIPMDWSLRLITYRGPKPQVRSIVVGPSGSAAIPRRLLKHARRASLVVFGQAPKTTARVPIQVTTF